MPVPMERGAPVGILDSFERGLERVVNGAFAKTFKSGLQPLEVTAALRRELDTKAAVVARDRILVPNDFTVRLAPDDYARMTGLGPALIDEFTQLVQQHGMAPLANNMGLFIATPSYNGRIAFSIISERAIMPDIAFFRECIDESFADLMAAAPKPEKHPAKPKAATAKPKAAAKSAAKRAAKANTAPKPATKVRAKPVAKGNATGKNPKKQK